MPIVVQVPVDVPATTTISYDVLRDELTRYAKRVVNSYDMGTEVMAETELMSHAMTIDDVRKEMHAWAHNYFQGAQA